MTAQSTVTYEDRVDRFEQAVARRSSRSTRRTTTTSTSRTTGARATTATTSRRGGGSRTATRALIKEVFEPQQGARHGLRPGLPDVLPARARRRRHRRSTSAPPAATLAPESVARPDHRRRRPTEPHVEERAYDLVICREVFEHLTVLQVRRTVDEICRASSRFVYVTTRFHDGPARTCSTSRRSSTSTRRTSRCSTRSSCAACSCSRASRAGPTWRQRMDWADKGRVLVYERRDDV